MQLTVEGPKPGEFRWTVVASSDRRPDTFDQELSLVIGDLDGSIQLWIQEVDAAADGHAIDRGFVRYRDLWQLRCQLPNAESALSTRAFTSDDLDDFIRVNNRAFAWHPEQGGLTRDDVIKTMNEPWFDTAGFRLHHHDDELVAFCWTKIHNDQTPPLGEIYVIAVDPDHHGRGLGKQMTLNGLAWLSEQGLRDGMLYVESDNDAANATYSSIGFERHHTDRAYRLDRR